jgi:predicted transcriptional regulator
MLHNATLLVALAAAALSPGQKPKSVKLAGDDGGRTDGAAWTSDSIKDKVWAVFYVDPDEKDSNEALEAALKAQDFPKEKYGSMAVINMAATWLPNAAIASSLKSKQADYPDTVYVKDLNKVLVKEWGLKDDAYDVLVFDRSGKVVYAKDGVFTKQDTTAMIDAIKAAIAAP